MFKPKQLFLSALTLITVSSAQLTYAEGSQTTGLFELYKAALSSDPLLQQAISNFNSVKEIDHQTFAAFLPTISASASKSKNRSTNLNGSDSSYDRDSYGLNLQQSIYNHSNYLNRDMSKMQISASKATLQEASQSLLSRVTTAYFDVLLAADKVTFAKAELKAISRQLEQAKQRYDVGIIAITEVLNAQAGYDSTMASVLLAENEFEIALEKLKDVTGIYVNNLSQVADNIPLLRPQPDNIQHWIDLTLENNPAYQAMSFKEQVAQKNVKLQSAGHYPNLALTASYQHSSTSGPSSSALGVSPARKGSDTSLALQLQVPLYQGGLVSSKTRQAQFDLDALQQQKEGLRRNSESQTKTSYLSLISSISQVKALKQAVISNESALEAMQAGFEVGTRTIVDVLNVQRDLFAAKKNHSAARYNYIKAMIALKQSAGVLSEKDIAQVESWLKKK